MKVKQSEDSIGIVNQLFRSFINYSSLMILTPCLALIFFFFFLCTTYSFIINSLIKSRRILYK